MSNDFTPEERKEVVTKLLQVEKFLNYSQGEKIELLKNNFVIFKAMPDQAIADYIEQLYN